MRFYALDKLINLYDGYSRQFRIDNVQLLLREHLGEHYILEANCPHRSHPLSAAVINDGNIRCPLHQYEFCLRDGNVMRTTEEPCRGLRIFEVVYEGNEIGVMLDD